MENTTQYKTLLSPYSINELVLKNRILMAPMGDNLCNEDGSISERQERYFEARAKGGCAGIILGSVGVSRPCGQATPLELSLANDDLIESYKLFVQKMHTYDCKVIAQIKHGGSKAAYAASIGVPFLVPSLKEISEQEMDDGKEMVSKLTQNELAEFVSNLKGAGNFKEMTKEDIDEVIDQFQQAAKRAYKAGLDGVEIHAGHGYIISAFLSSATNKRDDEYGGSKENRIKFLVEILQAVRSVVPKTFPIIVRLDGEEINIPNGIDIEESIFFAKTIEPFIDAIHVSSYANAASGPDFTKAPLVHQRDGFISVTKQIKQAVDIPIIGVGRIETKDAENYIEDNKFDFIAMGRKLLADPELPNKLLLKKETEIKPCQYSYECVSRIFLNGEMVCASDLNLGKSISNSKLQEIDIIGAGPAGMELAIQSAERGIPSRIYEKENFVGGKLISSALIYKPYRPLLEYYRAKMDHKLIEINLNHEIKSFTSDNEGFIDASGSVPQNKDETLKNIQDWLYPFIRDANGEIDKIDNAISCEEILNVCIHGTNTIQLHAAKYLDQLGMNVTLLQSNSKEEIGKSMPVVLRWKIIDDIKDKISIIELADYSKNNFDLNLTAEFKSKNSNANYKIGDSDKGLSYIPQATKDAANFFEKNL